MASTSFKQMLQALGRWVNTDTDGDDIGDTGVKKVDWCEHGHLSEPMSSISFPTLKP